MIKTAAVKTNAMSETRKAHKPSDPDRSRGVDVVDCAASTFGDDAGPGTAAAETCTAD